MDQLPRDGAPVLDNIAATNGGAPALLGEADHGARSPDVCTERCGPCPVGLAEPDESSTAPLLPQDLPSSCLTSSVNADALATSTSGEAEVASKPVDASQSRRTSHISEHSEPGQRSNSMFPGDGTGGTSDIRSSEIASSASMQAGSGEAGTGEVVSHLQAGSGELASRPCSASRAYGRRSSRVSEDDNDSASVEVVTEPDVRKHSIDSEPVDASSSQAVPASSSSQCVTAPHVTFPVAAPEDIEATIGASENSPQPPPAPIDEVPTPPGLPPPRLPPALPDPTSSGPATLESLTMPSNHSQEDIEHRSVSKSIEFCHVATEPCIALTLRRDSEGDGTSSHNSEDNATGQAESTGRTFRSRSSTVVHSTNEARNSLVKLHERFSRRSKSQKILSDRERGRDSTLSRGRGSVLSDFSRSQLPQAVFSTRTPNPETGETWNGLRRAVERQDQKRVEELLAAGVSANMPYEGNVNEPAYVTLLHSLCNTLPEGSGASHGNVTLIESLLKAGANVNPRSSVGCTPLMRACVRKNYEAARLLVEWQADAHARDDAGFDALRLAIQLKSFGSSGGTIAGAASFNSRAVGRSSTMTLTDGGGPKKDSPEAAAEGIYGFRGSSPHGANASPAVCRARDASVSAQIVKLLLEMEGPLEHERHETFSRRTSIHDGELLCLGMEGVTHLTACAPKKEHSPPLLHAVRQQNHQAAAAILANGYKPMFLRDAVETGCADMVRVLLAYRANPQEEDAHGESPMDIALQCADDSGILDLLREASSTRGSCLHPSKEQGRSKKGGRRPSVFSRNSGMKRTGSHLGVCSAPLSGVPSLGCSNSIVEIPVQPTWWQSERSWLGNSSPQTFAEKRMYELSKVARRVVQNNTFQTLLFVCLLGALFLPDMWVLMDAENDAPLDVLLVIFLTGFLIEIFLNILGLRDQYWLTFFFYMDVVGAFSLLFDMSFARDFSSSDHVGDRTIIMRAARAAKLGARAGRFTKLVKLLRFLPGIGTAENKHVGTAKGMARALQQQISVRVSCIIILMVVLLPVFNFITYPEKDWSMKVWTDYLGYAAQHAKNELDVVLADFRAFYDSTPYFPYMIRQYNATGDRILWQKRGPLRPSNVKKYSSGEITVLFDFGSPNRLDAAMNLGIMMFTIMLMMGFALMLSHSVSKIGLIPLESVLAKVREIGSTIYTRVEFMQREMKNWSSMSESAGVSENSSLGVGESATAETVLLEGVVKKIAVLSEITMKNAKPCDKETLMYLGESHQDAAEFSASKMEAEQQVYESGGGSLLDVVASDHCLLEDQSCAQLVGSWEFTPFALDSPQSRAVCTDILGRVARKAVPNLHRPPLQSFVNAVAASYLPDPSYHNWHHAVDVMHTTVMVLHKCSQQSVFLSWLEEYAIVVSAISHDIGHPGVNNDYLVQMQHELAMRYNDTSPLENMHCACLFEIAREPRSAIFGTLPREKFKEVRSTCIEAILHTDNSHHVPMVKKLQMFGEVNSEILDHAHKVYHQRIVEFSPKGEEARSDNGSAGGGWPTKELSDTMWEPDARRMLRNALLHFADISNPLRPFTLCKEWAVRVLEEFFAQGDMEKEAGFPVQPLNDRTKTSQPFSQVSFIEFFVAPLVFAAVRILTPLEDRVSVLLINASTWAEEWMDESNALEEEIQHVVGRLRRLEERAPRIGMSLRRPGSQVSSHRSSCTPPNQRTNSFHSDLR